MLKARNGCIAEPYYDVVYLWLRYNKLSVHEVTRNTANKRAHRQIDIQRRRVPQEHFVVWSLIEIEIVGNNNGKYWSESRPRYSEAAAKGTVVVDWIYSVAYSIYNFTKQSALHVEGSKSPSKDAFPHQSVLICIAVAMSRVQHNGPQVFRFSIAENVQRYIALQRTATRNETNQ